MTRAEEYEAKSARYRKDYGKYKERQREKSKEWYWANRDYALKKAEATRKRLRENSKVIQKPLPPSIDSLEEALPYELRMNTALLRVEFLRIPILQRPPYDIYLRQKTAEYYKEKANDRRTED